MKSKQSSAVGIDSNLLQSVTGDFWYGKPKDYTNFDEIEFFKYVPTVWDETKYLSGEIGENISVTRRKGTNLVCW